jgi:monofunctional chorismate mutase
MWYKQSVFYQIYPLGFTNSPKKNDGIVVNRISKVNDWINHFNSLGINTILFNPVFESDTHGYDTIDYRIIDQRLGSNQDFENVCNNLHKNNIKVVLDGVFNHVGRNFWAFKDVLENKENSKYQNWFKVDYNGNTVFNDGFYYKAWENHYELVELNLENDEVISYLFECIKYWIEEFDIDGLRLDVAYSLNEDFLRKLRTFTTSIKDDFYLVGETLHGDYSRIMNDSMLHSVTNYQAYKGLWSSFNSMNLFEIEHTFQEHYINKYPHTKELNFVDNHDVNRIATMLNNPEHLPLIYGLLFSMVGTPCIYYGSEWGTKGDKNFGDESLRVSFDKPVINDLSLFLTKLIDIYHNSSALKNGGYNKIFLTNKQLIFERKSEQETILVAINCEDTEFFAKFNYNGKYVYDLISNASVEINGGINLKAYSVAYYKLTDVKQESIKNDNQLVNARNSINSIDKEMAKLFERRMRAVEEVIDYKLKNNMNIFDSSREQEVINKNLEYIKDDKLKEYYREYITLNMEISKKYQKNIKNKK